MALKLPPKLPKLLEKVIRFGALQWKDGKLLLHGIPVFIALASTIILQQKILDNVCGKSMTCSIMYSLAKLQAKQGTAVMMERFGYAHKIEDKKKIFEFNMGQSDVLGSGKLIGIKLDFNKQIFIIKSKSTFAEEYKRTFGLETHPVDYFLRGSLAGGLEPLVNKKMLCIETKCVAQGNPYCIFVIKPIEKWDKKTLKKENIKDVDFKKLGANLPGLY